jgi:hypothetical protein
MHHNCTPNNSKGETWYDDDDDDDDDDVDVVDDDDDDDIKLNDRCTGVHGPNFYVYHNIERHTQC